LSPFATIEASHCTHTHNLSAPLFHFNLDGYEVRSKNQVADKPRSQAKVVPHSGSRALCSRGARRALRPSSQWLRSRPVRRATACGGVRGMDEGLGIRVRSGWSPFATMEPLREEENSIDRQVHC
jgi:hypothetical protein